MKTQYNTIFMVHTQAVFELESFFLNLQEDKNSLTDHFHKKSDPMEWFWVQCYNRNSQIAHLLMPSGVRISFPDKLYNNPIKQNSKQVTLQYPCNSGSTCYPYEVTFSPGTYTIECYGAGYANNPKYKSYGAYTKGTITFIQKKNIILLHWSVRWNI